jgi:hypothetical protein
MCGINSLYMVVVMHAEHRPYQAPEFPHNPARDTWQAEDSRVTFFPDMDRYGTVKDSRVNKLPFSSGCRMDFVVPFAMKVAFLDANGLHFLVSYFASRSVVCLI